MASHRFRRALPAFAVLVATAVAAASWNPAEYWADEPRPTVRDHLAYFGDPASFRTPAVVRADAVFLSVPEYRTLVRERLKEGDARYWFLLSRASQRFRAAVERAARDAGHDLVAETGAVDWPGHEIPDITTAANDEVEAALRSEAKEAR
jgi:hypothetical protein